ncbi:hypothetical protein FXE82_14110 [Vibrio cholerae]|uniref:hypothetical protein n=1 Tax=Vibrio cholerae TaxID=666 RepID=UPI0011D8B412|nr:hypothetical protein [Vibrio cholerae]EGR0555337.1 hypothetical protein [Vibrio cholerae]ELJ8482203.1 hypothetical protein [Vibrio cholerae]TXY37947.1 hypothetical protein FXE82_14110 [Vibrio cholerae]GIB68092.1 hypothetical protein VCSRO94_0656 [Vibrio cholerae]HDI3296129.1 hypothetical protein [Vibrio cholerae]
MTHRQSETFNNRVYVGAHGNLSLEEGKLSAKNTPIDTVFAVLELPIGLKLTGVRLVTNGLGASVSVDIKVNDIALALGEAVANKVAKQIPIKPVYLKDKGILNVTIKGGAATGELLILPEYVNVGS